MYVSMYIYGQPLRWSRFQVVAVYIDMYMYLDVHLYVYIDVDMYIYMYLGLQVPCAPKCFDSSFP